jgi:pimeloyl-ACP methyl ester carboxylesterase
MKHKTNKKASRTIGFLLLAILLFGIVLLLMIASGVRWYAYLILSTCIGLLIFLRGKKFWHGWRVPLIWLFALTLAWIGLFAGQPPLKLLPYTPLHMDYNAPQVDAAYEAENALYKEYSITPKDYFITLDQYDIKIRVTEVGDGPPVIIVPGNTGEAYPFVPLLPELSDHTVYLINRPGGGMSEGINYMQIDSEQFAINTISGVMDTLSIDSADLIAHSMGGHWALWFTQAHPERVNTLTLIGCPGGLPGTGTPASLKLMRFPGITTFLRILLEMNQEKDTMKVSKSLGDIQGPFTSEAMSHCREVFPKLPNYPIAFTSLLEAGPLFQQEILNNVELTALQTPTLLLWGTNDPFGTPAAGQAIADTLPNGTFHEIQDGSHLPWLDQPHQCGEIIKEFWKP